MRLSQKIVAAAILAGMLGCGYHLLGKEVHLPGGVSRVYVETAKNDTMEAGLEQIFTQRLLERLRADGRITLVGKDEADAVLQSELLKSVDQPMAYNKFGRGALLQVEISARVTLVASKENKKLWDSGVLREREEFPVGDDFLATDRLRDKALNQISIRLTRVAVELLTSGF